jgi:hypothetical protein
MKAIGAILVAVIVALCLADTASAHVPRVRANAHHIAPDLLALLDADRYVIRNCRRLRAHRADCFLRIYGDRTPEGDPAISCRAWVHIGHKTVFWRNLVCDEVDGLPYLPATGQSADTPLDTAPERL